MGDERCTILICSSPSLRETTCVGGVQETWIDFVMTQPASTMRNGGAPTVTSRSEFKSTNSSVGVVQEVDHGWWWQKSQPTRLIQVTHSLPPDHHHLQETSTRSSSTGFLSDGWGLSHHAIQVYRVFFAELCRTCRFYSYPCRPQHTTNANRHWSWGFDVQNRYAQHRLEPFTYMVGLLYSWAVSALPPVCFLPPKSVSFILPWLVECSWIHPLSRPTLIMQMSG